MPKTDIVFFRDIDGSVPTLDWIDKEVARRDRRAVAKGIPMMGSSKKRKTSDAAEILDRRYGGGPEWDQMVLEEEIKARVGQVVYALRTEAELSQTRLAEMTKVTQALISKVENGDYDGDYFGVLLKVCFVLHKRVDVAGPGVPLSSGTECCAVIG